MAATYDCFVSSLATISSSQSPFHPFQDRVLASSSFSDDQGDDETRQLVFSGFYESKATLFSEVSTKPWPSLPLSQIARIHPSPSFRNPETGSALLFFFVELRLAEAEPETNASAAIKLCSQPNPIFTAPLWLDPRYLSPRILAFREASPEAKATTNLQNFFTFLAVKIVLAQLESYNPEAYEELMEFISRHSLNDGNKFCANLMRESPRHQTLDRNGR